VYKSDKPDTEFDLDEEGLKKLHAIAFMKSASERENHNIKEVQVYLPLPLLQVHYLNTYYTEHLCTSMCKGTIQVM
jgi:hypothetical protein